MAQGTIKEYYQLTKPGIVYSNTLAAIAAYLYASEWSIDPIVIVSVIIGVMTLIAASCVYNNYLDRGIDTLMKRTQNRALVSGRISGRNALLFATVLLVVAFTALSLTNALTVILGVVACVTYIFVYGYFKRTSVYGTLVGSIPGALPPVAGYTAVTGSIDVSAVILFAILTLWQMPHFYAIAIFRKDEYKAAGVPVLPVVKGFAATKRQIMAYALGLAIVAPLITIYGNGGYVYLIGSVLVTMTWVIVGVTTYRNPSVVVWARKMFFYSLIVLLALLALIATASVTP